MLRHYTRLTARTLVRGGRRTIVNILGLSIGLAVCLLIVLFVQSEIGYDDHFERGDRLYRVSILERDESGSTTIERVNLSPAVGAALAEHYASVESMARLMPVGPSFSFGDQTIYPEHTYWGDAEALDLLELELVSGDGRLSDPHSILLSESTAERLAGHSDLVGESVTVAGEEFIVSGVFRDVPERTHLHIDAIGPLGILTTWFGTRPDEVWDSPNYATYIRLAPGADPAELESRLGSFFETHGGRGSIRNAAIRFQNVGSIHLHSSAVSEFEPQGSMRTIILMTLIAAVVLLIACVNYVNLATADALRRSKEVGLRKVIGATRGHLAGRFLGEAVAVAMISLLAAAALAEAAAPQFGSYVGKSLSLLSSESRALIPWMLAGTAGIGLLAGAYPALVLSSFTPIAAIRHLSGSRSGHTFRKVLVAGQFAMAVVLIVSTLVILRQLRFAQTQDPGFDATHVMLMPGMRSIADDFEPFRDRLLAYTDIVDVAHVWREPMQPLIVASDLEADVSGELRSIQVFTMFADHHYWTTFDIPMVAGRGYDPERDPDPESTFVLNESAVERLGLISPDAAVGMTVRYGGRSGTVVGVSADYHQESFHKPIVPMITWAYPQNYRTVAVRFRSNDIPALTAFLRDSWQQVEGDAPIAIDFLDDRFGAVYEQEQRLGRAFGVFSGLGIFVACLGLYGIAAAAMARRIREIGVRKAFGATTQGLTAQMTGDFLRLVSWGFVFGAPVAWYAMNRWLQEFAYHDGVGVAPFVQALLLMVIVAVLAVSSETWTAARANPVTSLRHE